MSEVYNLKLIQYENGQVEFRRYDKPINAIQEDDSWILDFEKLAKKFKERVAMADYIADNTIENPFTGKEEFIPEFDIEQQKELEKRQKEKHSATVSRKRTIQSLYKLSRQANWEYFITLTFDTTQQNRYDFRECMRKCRKWLNHQKERKASELKYLIVPEMHKDGAWHVHGLIANCGDMEITDSGRVAIGDKSFVRTSENQGHKWIYNLSGWKYGWSTATKVGDTRKVSTYITKYIIKELCACTKHQRRYFRSNNISEPQEYTFLVEGTAEEKQAYIQQIADSLGVDYTYSKALTGEFPVEYIFYEMKRKEEKENEV